MDSGESSTPGAFSPSFHPPSTPKGSAVQWLKAGHKDISLLIGPHHLTTPNQHKKKVIDKLMSSRREHMQLIRLVTGDSLFLLRNFYLNLPRKYGRGGRGQQGPTDSKDPSKASQLLSNIPK